MKKNILFKIFSIIFCLTSIAYSDENQKALEAFKKLMETAHPLPEQNVQVNFLIPQAPPPNFPIFNDYNMNEIETGTYQMQNESSIAINPKNPLNLIASAVDYRDNSATWVYVSSDGGRKWTNINLGRPFPNWRSSNDPSVAFSSEGIAYLVYGGFGISKDSLGISYTENGVFLARSYDEGKTWEAHIPIIIHLMPQTIDSCFEDKYYITVDNSPTSPYKDHLYVPWKRVIPADSSTQIVISKSTDNGTTWSVPIPISPRKPGTSEDTTYGQSFPLATCGPNGEVYVVWNDGIVHGIGFAKSTDGGKTFAPPRIIRTYNIFGETRLLEGQGWRHSVKQKVRAEAYPVIVCDIYSQENYGKLYLSWAADNPPNIYFSYSNDGGETWSEPIIVHSDTTNDQFWHWMAIDPKNGDLAIIYLDSRNDPANILVDCFVSYSSDGGKSWQDRLASNTSFDIRLNPFTGNSFAGDYSGCIFYNGIIYPSWVDMRNAVKNIYDSDVFTALIHVNVPLPPQNFTAHTLPDNPTEILLTWEEPKERAFGQPLKENDFKYIIYRNSIPITILQAPANSFLDKELQKYQKYDYAISAFSNGDTSKTQYSSAFAGGSPKPDAPELISAYGSEHNKYYLTAKLPTLREDKITPLVNLQSVAIYLDSIFQQTFQVTPQDTGKIVNFTCTAPKSGYYYIEATSLDNNTPPNESNRSNTILSYTGAVSTYFIENFSESTLKKYLNINNWGLSSNFYKSPPFSLTESPTGNYLNQKNYEFWLFPIKTENEYQTILNFWHSAIIDPSDTAFIEVSYDKGNSWEKLANFDKTNFQPWQDKVLNEDDWKLETIPIPNKSDTAIIRFRLKTSLIKVDDGWYIDDIEINNISSAHDIPIQENFIQIYPNPCKNYLSLFLNNNYPIPQTIEKINVVDCLGNYNSITPIELSENYARINLDKFSNGIYILLINFSNGQVLVKKFIINK